MRVFPITLGGKAYRVVQHDDGTFEMPAELARYKGHNVALKPAFEPVVVARKPLVGTVAANVLTHGTGALNIDGCRVQTEDVLSFGSRHIGTANGIYGKQEPKGEGQQNSAGRWPTNVVMDGDAAAELDEQSGIRPGMTPGVLRRGATTGTSIGGNGAYGTAEPQEAVTGYGDSGGASRFFPVFRYQAKAPTRERVKVGDVAHPTVKPLALMRWLVRLVTPPDGVVLDPFAGSGTTIEAAILEGFQVIGIERETDYLPLIEARIARNRITAEGLPDVAEALALFDFEEPA